MPMNSNLSTVPATLHSPKAAGPEVWNRLWRYLPSDAKDDALLAREERSGRWALIEERLKATFGSIDGLRTVELGSGRGDLSVLLARRGAGVTLLDASESALAQAQRRFERLGLPAQYETADILGTPNAYRERFDVALSSGVAEHFKGDDRTHVVHAHFEALRPGGLAVISVPNARCIPYRLRKRYLELRGWWPYGMELPYSRRELLRRARRAGFGRTEAVCMRFPRTLTLDDGTGAGRRHVGVANDSSGSAPRSSFLDVWLGLVLLLIGWRSS